MTRTRTYLAVLVTALACALVPFVAGSAPALGQSVRAAQAEEGVADWTMMIYAVADTSGIAEDLVKNLNQWTEVGDAANVNVVLLIDMPEPESPWAPKAALRGLGSFSTAKLAVLDDGRFNEVRDLGEVSMGRPDVLASFIAEAADRFPAQKYGLTFLDHGLGQVGTSFDEGPPGLAYLDVPEMREGMLMGLQAAGMDRFELVNMAACLMANFETATALGPVATAFSASEEVMIGTPLSPLAFGPMAENRSGSEVGTALIDGYAQLLDETVTSAPAYRRLAALSVVNGDSMDALNRAVDSFALAAANHMSEMSTQVARARADALELDWTLMNTAEGSDLVDLGDFLRHLTDVPDEVAVARDAVFTALQAAVSHQITGQGTEQATGLNVYFPTEESRSGTYFTDGTAPPGWARFLQAYFAAQVQVPQDESGSPFAFVSPNASVLQADTTGIKISAQLTSGNAKNVTWSETLAFTKIGGTDALAISLPAYVNAGAEDAVQGVWDYSLTSLSDGQKTVPVTSIYRAQSGGLVGQFAAQYTPPGGGQIAVSVRVLLSSEGAIESYVVSSDEPGGGAAGIELQVGGRLTPLIWVPSSGGFAQQLSSQSIDITRDFDVTFTRLPAGTPFELGVVVSDVAGNWASAGVAERVR